MRVLFLVGAGLSLAACAPKGMSCDERAQAVIYTKSGTPILAEPLIAGDTCEVAGASAVRIEGTEDDPKGPGPQDPDPQDPDPQDPDPQGPGDTQQSNASANAGGSQASASDTGTGETSTASAGPGGASASASAGDQSSSAGNGGTGATDGDETSGTD
ncbi:hypothetical protein PSM7751_00249 [Pseudooceanicola marinus]|uniref:Uncharacterized protein n=1 Tax=Pseudooceanicola marinus TaxID=396013 RepID=A0A1X6Y7Z5_9RHOB|nr:hypothetical protein [Pseudooceanicola marinus]SLN12910.1 hypothetical protein PSM7751_00249 [Pseudooceanicola marinus]